MAVKTSGNRGGWFSAVTVLLMDRGDTPLSIEQLTTLAARRVGPTARNDGYVTSRENGGDPDSYEAGWAIIVDELVALLRERKFLNGDLRWVGPTKGEVTWGGKKYPVRPADERQMRRDFNMVQLGSSADYGEVQVVGARGGITKKHLEVHPLAHLLPPIPAEELAELRKDIDANGVLVPLVMYEGKVFDGRHRLYLAATLDKPVRLETFEGSEEEARARIGSLNMFRRHLKPAQRTQLAIDLYMTEAKQEAAEAKKNGSGTRGSSNEVGADLRQPAESKRAPKASQLVAKKTGGAVNARAVEAMQVVQQAPETLEKVRSGEITAVTVAEKAAREELGKDAPPKVDAWKTTINGQLGRMLSDLKKIKEGLDLELGADPETLKGRIEELQAGLSEVLSELEERSAI